MQKQRHGCVTWWLAWMIISSAGTALLYVTMSDWMMDNLPGVEEWLMPVMGVLALVNVVFAVALFKWKRWGFYGFCGMTVIALVLNLAGGLAPGQSIMGLLGIGILWIILQVKGADNVKAWDHLE